MTEEKASVSFQDSAIIGDVTVNQNNVECPSCSASNVKVMKCNEVNCEKRFCELCHLNCRYGGGRSSLRFDSGSGSGPFCSECLSAKIITYKKRSEQERLASEQERLASEQERLASEQETKEWLQRSLKARGVDIEDRILELEDKMLELALKAGSADHEAWIEEIIAVTDEFRHLEEILATIDPTREELPPFEEDAKPRRVAERRKVRRKVRRTD